jgi:hypothetical protein
MHLKTLLIASVLIVITGLAQAEVLVKCFEAQMVRKSDCDTNLSPEECNKTQIDVQPEFWVYLPQDICMKIVGESLNTPISLAPKATKQP